MHIRREVVLAFFLIIRVFVISQDINDTIKYIEAGEKYKNTDLLYPYFDVVRFNDNGDKGKSRFYNKLFNDNLIKCVDNNSLILIDPIIEISYGYNIYNDKIRDTSKLIYDNARGMWFRGSFNEKVYFSTTFIETTSKFPFFKDEYIRKREIIPGKASYKEVTDDGLYDYGYASGYFVYKFTKNIFIQGGQDKLFVGNGNSSLVVSENSNNYPFIRVSFGVNNFQYNVIYAKMYDINLREPFESRFHDKYANIYTLSYKLNKFNVGIFESVIYNSNSVYKILDGLPFIGYHTIDKQVNRYFTLSGFNVNVKSGDRFFYLQYAVNNKREGGVQLGVRNFNTFNINNLNINLEIIKKSKDLYGLNQEYMNYNQYIGYPNIADGDVNFDLNYKKSRFVCFCKSRYIFYSNISRYFINNFFVGYEINKSSKLTLGIEYGNLIGVGELHEHLIMVKLKTVIDNLYNEFASFL